MPRPCIRRTLAGPFAAALLLAGGAQAATYTVTTLGGEAGSCSGTNCTTIRAAVAATNATVEADTIRFAEGLSGTIQLDTTLALASNRHLTVDGDNDGSMEDDGSIAITLTSTNTRTFDVGDGDAEHASTLTLKRLRFANSTETSWDADGGDGTAVRLRGESTLDVEYCEFLDNQTGGNGGAISAYSSTVAIRHSTFSGNRAELGGAISLFYSNATVEYSTIDNNQGYWSGGGIQSAFSTLAVRHSTISHNLAYPSEGDSSYGAKGGGISFAALQSSRRTLTIEHSTLIGNAAQVRAWGSGIDVNAFTDLVIRSSVFKNEGHECVGEYGVNTTVTHSMFEGSSISCLIAPGEHVVIASPDLGPLADNGGPTRTHLPIVGGNLHDAVDCGEVADNTHDQRGIARPQGARCDLGAVERSGHLVVTTEADELETNGQCSLREAIENINLGWAYMPDCAIGDADNTISFAPSVARIRLAGRVGVIRDDVVAIDGARPNGGRVILDGDHAATLFIADGTAKVTLRNIELVNGYGDDSLTGAGGAVTVGQNARLTLENCAIRDSASTDRGGAALNFGQLTIRYCDIAGNEAATDGGAVASTDTGTLNITDSTLDGNVAGRDGGGVWAQIRFDVHRSTLSNNVAGRDGGGLWAQGGLWPNANSYTAILRFGTVSGNRAARNGGGVWDDGYLGIEYETLMDNQAADGGGIYKQGAGRADLDFSVIAGSTGGDCKREGGAMLVNRTLIEEGTACVSSGGEGNLSGDPKLLPLAFNGGTMKTHLPSLGSPLVNAAECHPHYRPADQRGVSRPQQDRCDYGAVEYRGEAVVTTGVDDTESDGACSLREAVENANQRQRLHGDCVLRENVILFAPEIETVYLSGAQLEIGADTLVIDGKDGVGGKVNVSGQFASRVINLADNANVTLSHLALLAGSATGRGGAIHIPASATLGLDHCYVGLSQASEVGGGIYNLGALRVSRCAIHGNGALGGGGGGVMNLGANARAFIEHSTLSGNQAASTGGGLWNDGTLELAHVTVAGNAGGANQGGGLFSNGGAVTLTASVVGDSTGDSGDCRRNAGTLLARWSLIEENLGCATSSENSVSADPKLGAFDNRLDHTSANLPQIGSPLLDAVACDLVAGNSTDQRDIAKPQGAICDLGAAEAIQKTLSVAVTGVGTVNAFVPPQPMQGGIVDCRADSGNCSALYLNAPRVELIAVPDAIEGVFFGGWSGACSGTGACVVSMDQVREVGASFVAPAVFTVTGTGGDAGVCTGAVAAWECTTIRAAVAAANASVADDAIVFTPGVAGNVVLGEGIVIAAAGTLSIDGDSNGDGVADIALNGDARQRVVTVAENATVELRRLNLTGGAAGSEGGGALLVGAGANVRYSHGAMSQNFGQHGGAILNHGTLEISRAAIDNNRNGTSTYSSGGAINNAETGTLVVRHSTFAHNAGGMRGGGLANYGIATLEHVTVAGNTLAWSFSTDDWGGAGIYNGGVGVLTLKATLVAANSANQDVNCRRNGGTIHAAGSLIQTNLAACVNGASDGNLDANAAIGAFGNHGGGTQTMLPGFGSPAIDAVGCALAADNGTDQRGIAKPQGEACDIGAAEVRHYALDASVTGEGSVGTVNDGQIAGCGLGGTCSAHYPETATIQLSATPAPGWDFAGWGGDCDAGGAVAMDAEKTCTAHFTQDTDIAVTISNGLNYSHAGQALIYTMVVRNGSGVDVQGVGLAATVSPEGALLDPVWACIGAAAAYCAPAEGEGEVAATLDLPAGVMAIVQFAGVVADYEGERLTVEAAIDPPAIYADDAANNAAADTDIRGDVFADGFE